jgi:putative transcriptional regulator
VVTKNQELKVARISKELTQESLAKRIGVTRQTIGLIEKGQYNPTLSLCLQICYELEKTLDDLFWKEEGK